MDLVKNILDQLSNGSAGKLGSLIDADGDAASYAAKAAVPALLSRLASMASQEEGAKKLANSLNQLDSGGMDDFARMLGGDANAVAQKGSGLLNSLFGDSLLSGLSGAIGRYSGLAGNSVKGLLAFLTPLVLSKVSALWKSTGGTPQSLTNLFAGQRQNIADAMPAGFSLADVPSWPSTKDAVRSTAATGRRAVATAEHAAPSVARWAVPLALGLLGAFLLWNYWRPEPGREVTTERALPARQEVTALKPVAPETPAAANLTAVSQELQGLYDSAGDVMASIKDAASAEAALPQLEKLNAKIDATRKLLGQLSASGQTAVQKIADERLGKFSEQAETTLAIPGISEEFKTLISSIVQKLTELFAPAAS